MTKRSARYRTDGATQLNRPVERTQPAKLLGTLGDSQLSAAQREDADDQASDHCGHDRVEAKQFGDQRTEHDGDQPQQQGRAHSRAEKSPTHGGSF